MDEDLDSGAAGMTEESASSGPISAKKRRKSAPVPPDEFVGDRIKQLKTTIIEDSGQPMDTDIEGQIEPGHSKGEARR
jgi:hypothetical protein